jgi:hypothetical protein
MMTKEKNVNFIQIGKNITGTDKGTLAYTPSSNTTVSWEWNLPLSLSAETKKMNKNPYVPNEIHVNEKEKMMVVKWADGTETKVTCDAQDNFSVDVGYCVALAEHVLVKKAKDSKMSALKKLTVEDVGKQVLMHTLGHAIDMHIEPQEIDNPELSTMWADAEVAMNKIQLYLEEQLGEDFFK